MTSSMLLPYFPDLALAGTRPVSAWARDPTWVMQHYPVAVPQRGVTACSSPMVLGEGLCYAPPTREGLGSPKDFMLV